MLDSTYMDGSAFGTRIANSCACLGRIRPVLVPRVGERFALLFLMLALAATLPTNLAAQDSYFGNPQSSSMQDCSNPLNATAPQCAAQNQGQNQQTTPRGQNGAGRGSGVQPGNLGSYTDIANQGQAGQNPAQLETPLPPEPLTELQKFVASTTGQILPIYGANLFRRVPSTFAPLDMAPVPPDYVIGPDDELRIRIWGQISFQANVRVDRSGDIYLPQIGPVHVANMPFSALDGHLRSAVGRVFRNFDLTADVGQIRAIQVYVTGEARRPGVYTISSLSTLVDALFASGGPSVEGSLRHIELRRGGISITEFDLYLLLVHGDKSKDVKLQAGDVIFIPPARSQVAVTGSVRKPGIYELRDNESLADLLADAGEASSVAEQARISIERIDAHRDRHAMEVAYDQGGLATPVANGDLIRVYSIVPLYRKTVILRGNTSNPGRFAWHSGMHVSELIPDKESLITRNYWWMRTQLGLPAPEFELIPGFSEMRQPTEQHAITLKASQPQGVSGQNQPGMPQGNYGAQQDLAAAQLDQSGMIQQNQSGVQQNQFGVQQSISGVQQNQSPNQPGAGASQASGKNGFSYRTFPSAQRTEVQLLAPEIDWNYAVIERLDPETLKTTLVPFDLGKLVQQHDSSQDLELQPGDVVSIFSQDDFRVPLAQQTKLVRLDGEIAHAGVYSVKPGESLRQLVERAGGTTPNAYLYGSEFSRESTRELQQARIDEYVQNLDMQIQRSNLQSTGSPMNSAQDLASGQAAQNGERAIIARLRQVRATGRIVLEFEPGSDGIDSIPDIAMEDGDRFVVPPVPASVNVVGAVYDQNSFLYQHSRRTGAYLQLAGGPNRDADRRHMFIIRANGSVSVRGVQNGLWDNQFNNLRIDPGDTIVVPEKTFKPSALRSVIEWSQMFSQFALGAASLSVLTR